MTNQKLDEICFDDRFRFMVRSELKIPFVKRVNADLMLKLAMALVKSIGATRKKECLFVDEVRNRSMITTLHNAIDNCPYSYDVINIRDMQKKYPQAKVGVFRGIWLLAALCFGFSGLLIASLFLGHPKAAKVTGRFIRRLYQAYLAGLKGSYKRVYTMSDHHFFSCITCVDPAFESHVLQHGLVLDKSYYYPIHADCFEAWGQRSRELLENDPKVSVSGTYKFHKLCPSEEASDDGSVLYCVSILDNQLVCEKIDAILEALKGTCRKLKVKMHPGSFFSCDALEEKYGEQVTFYKECDLADLQYSFGVIENSTITIDFLCLNKPFVIYDSNEGYFSEYEDTLPWAKTAEELKAAFQQVETADFSLVRQKVLARELNGGCSTLWEA